MNLKELTCSNCGAPLTSDVSPSQRIECGNCGSKFIVTDLIGEESVICPNCQQINTEEKRFCSGCGQSLKVGCLLCYTENSAGTVHCVKCGAHLERARFRRRRMQQERLQHRLERQQILEEKEKRQREEKLRRLLEDLDEPENHDMAIFQINQMGVEAIGPLIDTLLHDDDPDARYGSARALGQICSQHGIKGLIKARSAKALIRALADPEPAVRYWSCDALGRCRSQVAVAPVAALLNDPHDGVRLRAREALQQIGGSEVEAILAATDRSGGLLGWIKGG